MENYLLFWERRHGGDLVDTNRSYLTQVVGDNVTIANCFRTFIHYDKCYNSWFVNELHTGINFAEGKTRMDAINDARSNIHIVGERDFLRWIIETVRRNGRIPKPYNY